MEAAYYRTTGRLGGLPKAATGGATRGFENPNHAATPYSRMRPEGFRNPDLAGARVRRVIHSYGFGGTGTPAVCPSTAWSCLPLWGPRPAAVAPVAGSGVTRAGRIFPSTSLPRTH